MEVLTSPLFLATVGAVIQAAIPLLLGRAAPQAPITSASNYGDQVISGSNTGSIQTVQHGNITNDHHATNYVYTEKKSDREDSTTPALIAGTTVAALLTLAAVVLAGLGKSLTPIFLGLLAGSAVWTVINARKSIALADFQFRKALPTVIMWIMTLACALLFRNVYYSVQLDGSTVAEDVEGLSSPENIALLDTLGRIVTLTRTDDSNVAFILGAFILLTMFFTFTGYYNLTWSAQIASSTRVGNSWLRKLGRAHNSRGVHDVIGMIVLLGVFVWLVQDDPIQITQNASQQWTRWIEEILT